MSSYSIEIANRQDLLPVDADRLRQAVHEVLSGEHIRRANVSIAVVDDRMIHELNARYLQHDYPTDALSFVLESRDGLLEGEIIVSAETAADRAGEFGWQAEDELLLYVIHGALHLAGCDDRTSADAQHMRQREQHYLARCAPRRCEPKPATTAAGTGSKP